MGEITAEYLYGNGEQNYAKKFSDDHHSVRSEHFFYPFQGFEHDIDENAVDQDANEDVYIVVIRF